MQQSNKAPASFPGKQSISAIAPSSYIDPKLFRLGKKEIENWGYELQLGESLLARADFFAGDDQARLEDLLQAWKQQNNYTIWCARGGYGATRLLPLLDQAKLPNILKKKPKLLIGYSDITALHLYAWHYTKSPSLHAALLASPVWEKFPKKQAKLLQTILQAEMPLGEKSHTMTWPTRWLVKPSYPKAAKEKLAERNKLKNNLTKKERMSSNARAQRNKGIKNTKELMLQRQGRDYIQGKIIGGNLSIICSLIGTKWQANLKNRILFIEDCAEAPYRIDRMLNHLSISGSLKGLKAVVVGDLSHAVPAKLQKICSWKEVLRKRFESLNIPVLINLPVGHNKRNEPLPLGIEAIITKEGKIQFLEQLVKK